VSDDAAAGSKPLIEYPSVYAFKVLGRQENGFAEFVRALFSTVMGTEVSVDAIAQVPSSKNTYVSLTVSVLLLNEEQRRAIYEKLHEEKRIAYYL
jgi:uncharacterized protein